MCPLVPYRPVGGVLRYARWGSHQDVGLPEHSVHVSEGALFPLRSFTSVKSFLDRSSLGTSKAFPVRVFLLTTFTQGYFRWSTASISASGPKFPRVIPNFRKVSSVSVCSPSSSSLRIRFLLIVQPSFPGSWIVCATVIVSEWSSRIRSAIVI